MNEYGRRASDKTGLEKLFGVITSPHFLSGLAITQAVLTSALIVIFLVMFSTQAAKDARDAQRAVEQTRIQAEANERLISIVCDQLEHHRDRNETIHALIPLLAIKHGISTNVEPLTPRRDPCGTSSSR